LRQCRDRIDREGGGQREGLLAVTQVFARIRYDRPDWMEILGGEKMMMDMPYWRNLVEQTRRSERIQTTVEVLEGRFGTVPPRISAGLTEAKEDGALVRLTRLAVTCKSLEAFQAALDAELPKPVPPSTRRRKKAAE